MVYAVLSFRGYYVGKANVRRLRGAPGLASRWVEHLAGLLFMQSRDACLGRYKVLRASLGSVSFFPLGLFASEVGALAAERALIVVLKPKANGADEAQLARATRLQGTPLRPDRAERRRPPRKRRIWVPSSLESIWCQEHFQMAVQKKLKQADRRAQPVQVGEMRVPKLPFKRLYRAWQARVLLQQGTVGPLTIWHDDTRPLLVTYLATR